MNVLQQFRVKDLTPRTITLSIALFVLATSGVVVAVVVKTMPGSATAGIVKSMRYVNGPAAAASTPAAAAAANPAVNGQDYSVIVSRNLFHPLETTITVAPPVKPMLPVKVTPIKVSTPIFSSVTRVAQPQVPELAYTGIVDVGGVQYALLERLEDQRAQYTRVGGSAFGYTLVALAEQAATLQANGTTMVLNIGANKQEEAITPPSAPISATATPVGGVPIGRVFNGGVLNNGNGAPNGTGPGGNANGYGGFRRGQRQRTMGEG